MRKPTYSTFAEPKLCPVKHLEVYEEKSNSLNHAATPVEEKKALALGRKEGKMQAVQLGIEPRASGNAQQRSNH